MTCWLVTCVELERLQIGRQTDPALAQQLGHVMEDVAKCDVQLADAELFVDPFVQALQVVASVGHPPGVVLLRRIVQIFVEHGGQILELTSSS